MYIEHWNRSFIIHVNIFLGENKTHKVDLLKFENHFIYNIYIYI